MSLVLDKYIRACADQILNCYKKTFILCSIEQQPAATINQFLSMKKTTLTLIITLVTLFSARSTYAQLWLMTDGGVFFTEDLVGYGINAKAAYHFGDYDRNMATFGGGFNMMPNKKLDFVVYDSTGLLTDTLSTTLTSNVITIDGDYRRYFFQTDADDYFAFYGLIGASLWMVNSKLALGAYADTIYAPPAGTALVQSNMSVRMPIGFGMDWTIRGRFWWYFEAKMELPFTQVNNDFIGNDFGVSYHMNTGVRILLWDIY